MKINPKLAISLDELNQDLTDEERKIVEAEKQYYEVVVALRNRREQKGLTQTRLSELANLPRSTITKVESGARNATLHTIMTMAQAMGNRVELRLV